MSCGLSIVILLFRSVLRWLRSRRASRRASQSSAAESQERLLYHEDREDEEDEEEETDSLAGLTLQKTVSHAASMHEVDKPKGEVWLVVVELLALLGEIAISSVYLAIPKSSVVGYDDTTVASRIAPLAVWIYICVLVLARLYRSASPQQTPGGIKIWYHTATLYGIQWFLEIFVFRSQIIHPEGEIVTVLESARFALSTLLFLIALVSRKGNKPVVLEYEGDLQPSQEPRASVSSLASFAWVDSIVWKGYKKTLELSDVWNVDKKDKAARVLSNFRQVRKTHRLAVRLLLYFKWKLLIQGAWAMLGSFCFFVPPLLLQLILQYLEDPVSTPTNAAWLYVILLLFVGCVEAVADGQGLWKGRKICINLCAIIVGELYSKALRRRAAADANAESAKADEKADEGLLKRIWPFGRKKKPAVKVGDSTDVAKIEDTQASTGQIINLMSIDSFKVAEVCAYLHFLWAAVPVQITMAIVLLYKILGNSAIAGVAMMVLLLPLNMYIARSFQRAQEKIMAATDGRIHSTNEVLQNIRIIKYFAWEQRFSANVLDKRRIELAALRKRYIIWSLAATTWGAVPILITFVSFLIYTVVEKKPLLPSVAFPALSTFGLLRVPLDQLADMIANLQQSRVSVDRVEEFLNEEETEKYAQLRSSKKLSRGEIRIGLEDATLTWGATKDASSNADGLNAFRLIDVSVEFQIGKLNIIAGPTGSGKTSLLMALLGEMKLLDGTVRLPGGSIRQELRPDIETGLTESVAYCAQQAWLVNDTIKQNILFASPFNQQRYRDVLKACALERDLEILDAGDKTLVGEKGIALSGGQKQRISLARALYSNSKHILLDDCLSAVDSHTAKHIFEQAIIGELMVNRTCILVTHNTTLTVPRSSYVVALQNGKVATQGTPDHVVASGVLGDELLRSRPASRGNSTAPSRVASDLETQKSKLAVQTKSSVEAKGTLSQDEAAKKQLDTRIEKKAQGSVKLTTITIYLKAMGPWYFWVFAIFGFVAAQLGQVSTNVWIREWANSYHTSEYRSPTINNYTELPESRGNIQTGNAPALFATLFSVVSGIFPASNMHQISRVPSWKPVKVSSSILASIVSPDVDVGYYLGIYAVLGFFYVSIILFRELLLFWGSIHASWIIHGRLLDSVMRAKFKFFDSTPLGQLMNRFSKDIQDIDQAVAPIAIGMIHSLASIITIVILISVITPGFLIAGVFISAIYFATGYFYIHSSRDLKRIEAVQRSPLFQAFGETLSGVVTIRAYGDESRFLEENHERVNTHNRPFIYLWATNRWLAWRVDIAGALVSFFTGVFVITNVGNIDPGAAGLALSYAVTFTENVLWLVRLYAANEQNMNAVERIKEYDVEQEAARDIPETKPAANWPTRGEVHFIGYSTRYRNDLDLVLKNVSFEVKPSEKVGIVGRTGAGKSSLALALFRGLEAEEGKILIDDIDIGLIGLQDLRESITIVPQDPTLFTGTLRSNLDPFGLFTDEEIFTALRRVQLVPAAGGKTKTKSVETSGRSTPDIASTAATLTPESSPKMTDDETAGTFSSGSTLAKAVSNSRDANKNVFLNLSSQIAESGSNLSQGQRQLLCLARALLKSPKVLMMDEATASIDYATDSKIQETLRELKDNTIITIAHRLQTIIDYDKVLVLDKGEVIEYADPWELIQKEGGSFRSMCETSGDFDTLFDLARKAWEERRLIDDS